MARPDSWNDKTTPTGLEAPNTTQIPNLLFDRWLSILNEGELKVLLYLVRRTFGFHKESDCASLRQIATGIVRRDGRRLDHGTGLGLTSVKRALQSLEKEHRLVVKESRRSAKGGLAANRYSLRIRHPEQVSGAKPTAVAKPAQVEPAPSTYLHKSE